MQKLAYRKSAIHFLTMAIPPIGYRDKKITKHFAGLDTSDYNGSIFLKVNHFSLCKTDFLFSAILDQNVKSYTNRRRPSFSSNNQFNLVRVRERLFSRLSDCFTDQTPPTPRISQSTDSST